MTKEKKLFIKEIFDDDNTMAIGGAVEPYIASKELIQAINLAMFLERPLLLKGEPGCGKTKFAKAIAYELYKDKGEDAYESYFQEWYIQSTSNAKDGFYTFDHIGRLRDAQLGNKEAKIDSYIQDGPLGHAFKSDKPTVLLIDEIDKANIDFPNDLLLALDEQRFFISEVKAEKGQQKEIKAVSKAVVIITSNNEKDLPDAFLRRCLFHYINFPKEKQLEKIVKKHFEEPDDKLVKRVVASFQHLRTAMEGDKERSEKKVSTSELIDWFAVINHNKDVDEHKESIFNGLNELPFSSVLLKSWEDHQRYLVRKEHKKGLSLESKDNE